LLWRVQDSSGTTQIQGGCHWQLTAQNAQGQTPLQYALGGFAGENVDVGPLLSKVVRLLLEHGADVTARDNDHSTPLHFAAEYGRVEVVHMLLERAANPGAEDDDRKTAFPVVLEYVNARDAKGKSPLHLASQGSNHESQNVNLSNVAGLLLEHGADVSALSNDRSTPLHVAARRGRIEVVRVLLEHGANAGGKDDNGRTALQVASYWGNDEVMKLLSEHRAG
jgi:ankyrin repeat protein